MTDFDYDVMQKKRTAAGAYHRKGGSKSKKCSLPSDNLTEAQKRKLNGPVTTVNLNQPVSWKDFKPLSDSLKKSYLINLLNTYKPNGPMLGEMFGVSSKTVTDELHRLGLPVGKKGGKKSNAAKAAWAAFCNGVVGGGDDPNLIKNKANEQIEAQDEQIESHRVWDLDSPDHVNAGRCEEVLGEDGDTILVPAEEAVERAKERLVSLLEQGASQYDEERESQYAAYYDAARDAVDEMLRTPLPAAPAPAVKEIRTRMSALAVRYEGPTDEVSGEIAELMSLFNGTRIKVKLSVEVVE